MVKSYKKYLVVVFISCLMLFSCSNDVSLEPTDSPPEIEQPVLEPEPTTAPAATEESTLEPEPTTAPIATEESTPVPEPTATVEPTPSGPFQDSGSEFVFAPTDDSPWESVFIFTAGVVEAEGEYYLYYTGIGRDWPENVGIGVANIERWHSVGAHF